MTTFATVTVQHEISEQRVRDMFCCAWEGGSTDWCQMIKSNCTETAAAIIVGLKETGEFYGCDRPFVEGCEVILREADDEIEDKDAETWVLNREKLIAGLQVMADKYPKHFADFLNENEDAGTGDIYLQCCLFQEIVYC